MQAPGKRVLVVADPTRESSGALQYALSHSLLDHDELILFHVDNSSNWMHSFNLNTFLKIPPNLANAAAHAMSSDHHGNATGTAIDPAKDFLEEMKKECNRTKPKLNVRVERVALEAGKDRANTILHHSEVLGVDILVIGQRPRSLFSKGHLGSYTWPGGRSSGSSKGINTAEYLIENCKCTCVGVQKKGQAGGYVLNSKTHKNFWLLA